MAEVLGPDYALEVVEAHHDQKKDAPSGTAVRLIEELCAGARLGPGRGLPPRPGGHDRGAHRRASWGSA